jgi:hypothetical protein
MREAARQLHVAHPTIRDWEVGVKTPRAPYREAIEVWTNGTVRAAEWPLEGREKAIADSAGAVKSAVPAAKPAA